MTLIAFAERLWVAQDDGWVVKAETESTIRHASDRSASDTTVARVLSLQGKRKLTEVELAERTSELGLIGRIMARRGALFDGNPYEDATAGLALIDELRRDHPQTPYTAGVEALERTLTGQRDQYAAKYANPPRLDPSDTFLVGGPAPDFIGTVMDGGSFSVSDLRGKPALLVLLNNHGSDEEAREALSELEKLKQKWAPRGLQVACVLSLVSADRIGQYRFFGGTTLPMVAPSPAYMPGLSPNHPLQQYRMSAQVVTVLIDEKGIVRHYRHRLYPRELDQVISELMK